MSSAGSYGSGGGGGGVGNVKFLTGNTGGPIAPDLVGNINVVGAGDINVAGNLGTNTLTISLSGAIADVYDADSGSATPSGGILNINGLGGITTTGSGNTIDVGNDGSLATIYNGDSGSATPIAENLNIVGGTGISTSATGDTVTIALSGAGIVESITGDAGGALTGNITITGGSSGAFYTGTGGNTLTTTFTSLVMSDSTLTTGFMSIGGRPVIRCGNGSANGNIFVGEFAGNTSLSGTGNAGLGQTVMNALTTGAHNVAVGTSSLINATTGSLNTAVGNQCLNFVVTGSGNIALGQNSASAYTTSEASNIIIGNTGTIGESNQIRIGTQGSSFSQQNLCNIAGIYGSTVGGTNAAVFIDNAGNLGTVGGAGGGVSSITGDTGPALTGNLFLTGGSSGQLFLGSGVTLTSTFHFLAMNDSSSSTGYIQIGASRVLAAYGGVANNNIFVGEGSGIATVAGTGNTGVGAGTLTSLSSTPFTGQGNVAVGQIGLSSCTTGDANVALGEGSLSDLTTGSFNTACGQIALDSLVTGSNNIALGQNAGHSYTTAESSNIVIGNVGVISESNQIRIGTQGNGAGQQDLCNIAGIYGSTVGGTNAAVFIDNAGNLGTVGGSGGGGVSSITGNAGGALTGALTLTGGTSGAVFTGAGTTLTTTFTKLAMSDTTSTTGFIQIGTQKVLNCYGGVANNNIFVGQGAGHTTVSGTDNDALGALALAGVTSGAFNIGIGSSALQAATSSSSNVAVGLNVLGSLTTGAGNNTAMGFVALGNLTTGDNNIAIGSTAGDGYTTNETSNIAIGAQGTTGESNVIRIGTQGSGAGQQNACFIAGIAGVTVASTAAVLVNTGTGQLGTIISSRRYKDNIHTMSATDSSKIYDLRPVEFTLKGDESPQKQFGLIAEEVQEVMPYLVAYDKEGSPVTVRYHELPTLLLNEIQRLKLKIDELEGKFNARVR